MALTPVDILHTQFKPALRGYNKHHVDEFVRSVREALEGALTEKNDLQRKVEALQEELDRIRKIESTMANALTLAQKSADELKVNAHREAEMILREAEQARVRMTVEAQQEAEKLRAEIGDLQATRDRFSAEFRALLSAYQELLEKRVIAVVERESDPNPQPPHPELVEGPNPLPAEVA